MLKNHVMLYLESLRAANMSPHTIRTYGHALDDLMRFVGPETEAREIDVEILRAHVHQLAARGLCAGSRNLSLRVLKSFGKFLVDERVIEDNIFEVIPRAKCPSRLISVPSVETVSALLDGKMPTAWPERDRAFFELLYGTGIRVHEAAGIMMEDIREDGTILIHGKGNKQRLVPMGRPLRNALEIYIRARRVMLRKFRRKSTVLFFSVSNRTKNRPPTSLDVRSVRRILAMACRANGMAALHPHSLRHACATHMLERGAPLTVIKELLGHEKLSTTAQYAFVSAGLMQRSYRASHPHAASD